ncbi:MAG: hypothetical protein RL557_600 [archaeon]|jgi:hypothetical protein
MAVDHGTLERLSNLDLRVYVGDTNAIRGEDKRLYEQLMQTSVEVIMPSEAGMSQQGTCEEPLYQICLGAQGVYNAFIDARQHVMGKLLREISGPGFNLLSILFEGIYVGEPEDLLNYRNGNSAGIRYPTKGLGNKLAAIRFNF